MTVCGSAATRKSSSAPKLERHRIAEFGFRAAATRRSTRFVGTTPLQRRGMSLEPELLCPTLWSHIPNIYAPSQDKTDPNRPVQKRTSCEQVFGSRLSSALLCRGRRANKPVVSSELPSVLWIVGPYLRMGIGSHVALVESIEVAERIDAAQMLYLRSLP